jgi:hypothetical protein
VKVAETGVLIAGILDTGTGIWPLDRGSAKVADVRLRRVVDGRPGGRENCRERGENADGPGSGLRLSGMLSGLGRRKSVGNAGREHERVSPRRCLAAEGVKVRSRAGPSSEAATSAPKSSSESAGIASGIAVCASGVGRDGGGGGGGGGVASRKGDDGGGGQEGRGVLEPDMAQGAGGRAHQPGSSRPDYTSGGGSSPVKPCFFQASEVVRGRASRYISYDNKRPLPRWSAIRRPREFVSLRSRERRPQIGPRALLRCSYWAPMRCIRI